MKAHKSDLVVFEDDPIIQWHLNAQFDKIGFLNASFYENESDLADVLTSDRQRVIFINLKLADGWIQNETIPSLRDNFDKIVILTGYRNNQLSQHLTKNFNVSFLYKPYSEFQINELISAQSE